MSVESSPPEVFISYSSKDRAKVVELARVLEGEGITIWRDHDEILGGENYGPKIVQGVRGAKAMLICCSDAAMRSKNVKQEIQLAWHYNVPYFPVMLENVTYPEQVEYWLLGWQRIDLFSTSLDVAIPKIVAGLLAVGAVGEPAAAPTLRPPSIGERRTNLGELWSAARLTDQIWPMPAAHSRPTTRSRLRDLGAPQPDAQHRFHLGSQVHLAIESDCDANLLLLNKGTSGTLYCLCPSLFAPNPTVQRGVNVLPQERSSYPSFGVTGAPGREHLLAILSDDPIGLDWMPAAGALAPARVLSEADVQGLVRRLHEIPSNCWTVLATYFEITGN